ncbi:TPA: P-II family nitrogen regulator [Candidatus Poribacteria bacterium]|nr:P-II family nitrogen regulator [Candidatus Poribacteria bacterium]
MKELKAYIRISRIDEVVRALKKAGAANMNIIHVQALGGEIDPKDFKLSFELVSEYAEVVKLELVCSDADAPKFVKVIKENSHTGRPGDGIIFITRVENAVKIRTGENGEGALA